MTAWILFVSNNLSQLELFAWFEFGLIVLWRRIKLRNLLATGRIAAAIPFASRRAALTVLFLLALGAFIPKFIVLRIGPMGWPIEWVGIAVAGTALRTFAVFAYVRILTVAKDGERLWFLLLAAGVLFAVLVREP